MDLESLFLPILNALDITAGLNLRVVSLIGLLTLLGEANIQIPLLIEAIWLLVGYQLRLTSSISMANLVVTFIAASIGRQIGISAIYYLFSAINTPLSRFYIKYLQKSKIYQKYRANELVYSQKFMSLSTLFLGMLTPLNFPIKVILVAKRKLRLLLVGTLLSGMAFDVIYIAIGAIFKTTSLQLTYFPLFLLLGFGTLILVRAKVLK